MGRPEEEMEEPEVEIEDEGEETPAEPLTLRQTLEAEFKKARAAEVTPEPADPTEKTQDEAKRARNEKGQFAAKETDKSDQSLEKEGKEPAAPGLSPPASWSAEEKAEFGTLPRKLQETLVRRESERDRLMSQKANEWTSKGREFEEIDQVLSERKNGEPSIKEQWLMHGINTAQGIRSTLLAQNFMNEDPIRGIQWFANQHGIDLRQVSQAQPEINPQVRTLQQQVQHLNQQLQQQQSFVQQGTNQALQGEIQSVVNEVDAGGKRVRPYFEQFINAPEFISYVRSLREANPSLPHRDVLDKAYQNYVWTHQGSRDALLKDREAEAERKRLEESKVKVDAAKRAGSSVSGAPNGKSSFSVPKNASLRDVIKASIDFHS